MCLSTAYKNEKRDDAILATYVAQVKVQRGKVMLYDVIGRETEVAGTLSYIDLEGGTVIINADVA